MTGHANGHSTFTYVGDQRYRGARVQPATTDPAPHGVAFFSPKYREVRDMNRGSNYRLIVTND